ncbi:hypothetical protein FPSE_00708 [Fusarium pseudograminearum CS3096]|uniref:Uncharacterized protein n=1 Tax=Fusarium pseudograminearum (strain CS3096) TaxID=1028729 RepID=K3VTE4_FUSPC|nr:hypothetical protein FPSE_00708 [Fusarium pseudograminearum CS3096]EKJ79107.1 hypothetical protein FPSE_00708 [Fusarium pseudograminearum CS3096]
MKNEPTHEHLEQMARSWDHHRKEEKLKAVQHAADNGAPSWYLRVLMLERRGYEDCESDDDISDEETKFDEDLSDLGDEDWNDGDVTYECECDESEECSCGHQWLTSEEKQRREKYTGSDAEYFYELKAERSQRKHEVEEQRQFLQSEKDAALKVDHHMEKKVQKAYAKLQNAKAEGDSRPIEFDTASGMHFDLYSSEFTQIWWDPYHPTRYIELWEMSNIEHTLGVPTGPGGIEPVQPQEKEKNEDSLDEEDWMRGHIYFNSDTGCDLVSFEAPKYIGLEEHTIRTNKGDLEVKIRFISNDYLIVTIPSSIALDSAAELDPDVKIPETFVFYAIGH